MKTDSLSILLYLAFVLALGHLVWYWNHGWRPGKNDTAWLISLALLATAVGIRAGYVPSNIVPGT